MEGSRWLIYAFAGAGMAAVVVVMTKHALQKLDVSIAITVQSMLMLLTLAIITTVKGRWSTFSESPTPALLMVAGSGVVAGLAWFFGYRALQLADVARATPIDRLSMPIAVILAALLFQERPTLSNWAGIALMVGGAYLVSQTSGE